MGLLIRAAIVGLLGALAPSGCYAPKIESCVLPCADDVDCPDGFSCVDKACVAGSVECPQLPDAASRPDAGQPSQLRIDLIGRGHVFVTPGNLTCSWPETTCSFEVGLGDALTLEAVAQRPNRPFQSWGGACAGTTGAVCTLTISDPATTVSATFEN